MERRPVTIWVAVRTFLVTAELPPPGAGSMVMVAMSWLLRGWTEQRTGSRPWPARWITSP
jgi:hypothetical protein